MSGVRVQQDALARLLPLHLRLDAEGRIAGMGDTLRKLIGDATDLASVFRPVRIGDVARAAVPFVLPRDGRVFLAMTAHPDLIVRGNGVALPDGGILLNLGLGIGLSEAVRRFSLTDADFAASDLAIEMLFLHEANGAMLAELSRSNLRLEEARQTAEVQAFTDPLTGLYNRRGLETSLDLALGGLGDGGFALVHMDLDLFKVVNDTHGHAAGDEVLRRVADRLRHATRAHDTVARVGGDEFVLILPGLIDRPQLMAFGSRVIAGIEAPVRVGPVVCNVSASLGIAISADFARPDADVMLADADRALYAAKAAGRARVCIAQIDGQGEKALQPARDAGMTGRRGGMIRKSDPAAG